MILLGENHEFILNLSSKHSTVRLNFGFFEALIIIFLFPHISFTNKEEDKWLLICFNGLLKNLNEKKKYGVSVDSFVFKF